jgi:glycosyltransferase involved in cell wall biosynthesis
LIKSVVPYLYDFGPQAPAPLNIETPQAKQTGGGDLVYSHVGEPSKPLLPGVAFAFRFGNEDGFVQRFFAYSRDLVARELQGIARCSLAFAGKIGNNPAFESQWADQVQANFYDTSRGNKRKLTQVIKEHRIVVVVFQGADLGEIDLRFFANLGVITINTEDHSFDDSFTQSSIRSIAKFILRRVLKRQLHDLHIANSKGQHEFHLRISRLPQQRLRIIPYGIDTEYYRPGNRRTACTQLGLDPETTWIMAAAQARPEKRVDMLIHAVRRVKDARPHTPTGFLFVGGGSGDFELLLDQWRELGGRLPFATDYRFFGKQSDMRRFYQAASIFVHGALKESFGLVIAEAMASGLPVVATRAHGPSEIIDHARTGYLIDRDDWDAFVSAVLSYLDQPELRLIHGDMGRQKCLECYTGDRAASEMARVIQAFLCSPWRKSERFFSLT